jgi:N6-L-threonylcarbamoyladenine synthase
MRHRSVPPGRLPEPKAAGWRNDERICAVLVLGIETSCDETAVALLNSDGCIIEAEALNSQVAMHREYGGVVPELASRDHLKRLLPLIERCLRDAGRSKADIDLIAVTRGPGLAGALLVGTAVAHALALALDKPVVHVHHLEGHLMSAQLADPAPQFPFVALLVSGGHTQLLQAQAVGDYRLLGETLDDAAGEAFDKTAQLLGLGYPGGPAVSQLAGSGTPGKLVFPRPMLDRRTLDMSFSGLKTAVLTAVRQQQAGTLAVSQADIACAFVDAVVDVLVGKSMSALRQTGLKRLVVSGGVGANRQLRAALRAKGKDAGVDVFFPPLTLCTDNGVMIARAGLANCDRAIPGAAGRFGVLPRWPLPGFQRTPDATADA